MNRWATGRAALVGAVLAVLLVGAATAAASPAKHATAKANTLVVGLPGIPPVFLGVRPYVALQAGYYKKWGVDVQLKGFTTGTDAARAVQAGQVDPYQHYDMLVVTKDTVTAKRALLTRMLAGDIAATRYMYNARALNRISQIATVTGHSAAVSKVALKEYLALKWWPLNRSGLGI